MKNFVTYLLLLLSLNISVVFAQVSTFSGTVSQDTTWSDTVKISSYVLIPEGVTLTIQPGTRLMFQESTSYMAVEGGIQAIGTKSDSIYFDSKDTASVWEGFYFAGDSTNTSTDTSFLSCVNIKHTKKNGTSSYLGEKITRGGAIHTTYYKSLTIKNSKFIRFYASSGCAIYAKSSNLIVRNSDFGKSNEDRTYKQRVINCLNSNTILDSCTFNTTVSEEEDMLFANLGTLEITNCSFPKSQGLLITGLTLIMDSCNFSSPDDYGNHITFEDIEGTITNNTFESTQSSTGSIPIINLGSSEVTIRNNSFQNNMNPCFEITNRDYSISNNEFKGNTGALAYIGGSSINLANNVIMNNKNGSYMFELDSVSGNITSNLIVNNSPKNRFFKFNYSRSADTLLYLTNNTICNNSMMNSYLVFLIEAKNGTNIIAQNNIMRNNDGCGTCIFSHPKNISFKYNNIEQSNELIVDETALQTSPRLVFEHNIDVDPLFVNPTSGLGSDYETDVESWYLKSNSVCINSGTNDTSGLSLPQTDLLGNNRVKDTVDMGALEFQETIEYAPYFYVATDSIDYGQVKSGEMGEDEEVDIRNYGKGTLKIDSIVCSSNFKFSINDTNDYFTSATNLSLKGGDTLVCNTAFAPNAYGNLTGELNIYTTDSTHTIFLEGEGEGAFYIGDTVSRSQTWNSEVYITSDVTIANGAVVTIEPGTIIKFQGDYDINIFGSIVAVGTEKDSIYFEGPSTESDSLWGCLNFYHDSEYSDDYDSSYISYVNLTDCESGIVIHYYSNLKITHSLFQKNYKLFAITACAPYIAYNTFYNNKINSVFPIIAIANDPPDSSEVNKIYNNVFSNNKANGGLIAFTSMSARCNIINNLFINNYCKYGVMLTQVIGDIWFINNTVCNNEGGALCFNKATSSSSKEVLIKNCVFSNNGTDKYNFINKYSKVMSTASIKSNCFADSSYGCYDYYIDKLNDSDNNNIFSDPGFVDPISEIGIGYYSEAECWSLEEGSSCIDAGDLDDLEIDMPGYDLAGNTRIQGDQIDIGAFEYNAVISSISEEELPDSYSLLQNYPNPFNPATTITYTIPTGENANVKLIIYNSLGQQVTTLVNATKTPGTYQVQFDASKLASGVYFYRITAGDFTQTKKMILLK